MFELLWMLPALPFAGFLILATVGARLTRAAVAVVGCGSVGLSALLSVTMAYRFVTAPPPEHVFAQTLYTWLDVGGLSPAIGFHLDALSLVMVLVITVVGFLIHLYSSEFMESEEGYSRFFAYMNLFVGAMLILVLADNLLLLLLGWEGVGLCSYLLIGFWYKDSANGAAARNAFIVTRVGDTAFLIGLFLLFHNLNTLNIQDLLFFAPRQWAEGSGLAVATAALLLGGAVGKSAQLPLQTWLPDAMAGPTPVSALIHAATMVTAGVYLIARMDVLFELAPAVHFLVAVIGAATLLLAGCSALVQRDIKRVLAYSTISQIGYMFLALGVGAWSAAMFHFMTHAFFKALLFLAAGAVILAQHHEHDMFKMGGLRKRLPATFWTFLIGAASLAALPLVTSGFYSKEWILWQAWNSEGGHRALWAAGFVGAFITALYTFRMVFVTFFGEPKVDVRHRPGWRMISVLVVLAILSTVAGFLETPHTLGHLTAFSAFMESVFPPTGTVAGSVATEATLQIVTSCLVLLGVLLAFWLYVRRREQVHQMALRPGIASLRQFWKGGWGFDQLYDALFVRPFTALAKWNRRDFIDSIYEATAQAMELLHFAFSRTQTGSLRWYAAAISLGTILIMAIVLFL